VAVARPARAPSRGEVYLVELDPTRGSEIRKTRPCLIVSPDELNHQLRTAIVAPMTTAGHAYPFRPRVASRARRDVSHSISCGLWIAKACGNGSGR
jgi:mRNA-degrading endonuclease toxin of MazEF toxin-antitoxin module